MNNKQKLEMSKAAKLGLNLKSMIKNDDYQDEFMSNYENFSQSWRDQIDKNKRFWQII